jgi:hypothetical protein
VSTSIGRDNVNTGKVFALSSSRRLLVFSSGLQLESWIELPPDEEHFSVSVTERFIALASSRSQFRLFDADTFEFRRKAPQPLRLLRHSSRLDCRYLRFLTHAEDDLQIFTGFSDNSFAIYDVSSASGESKEICSSNPPHNAPVEVLKVYNL